MKFTFVFAKIRCRCTNASAMQRKQRKHHMSPETKLDN